MDKPACPSSFFIHAMTQVYIADTLPGRYRAVFRDLTTALERAGVQVGELPGTRDVWARDYMPVPTPSGRLIQFRYCPDYLRSPKWQRTITDGQAVAAALGLPVHPCALVVDGGNIVRHGGRVLMTDKVFRENAGTTPAKLTGALTEALETATITWLPAHPDDFTGHADGLVHLVDEHTALVNDYRRREPAYWQQLRSALRQAGIEAVPVPANPYHNRTYTSAVGEYLNLLRLPQALLVPTYGRAEDEPVLRLLTQVFPRQQLYSIPANSLAKDGGVLHCVSWTPKLVGA